MHQGVKLARRFFAVSAGGLAAMALLSVAVAQEEPGQAEILEDIVGAVDTAWLMIAATLVFFMQAGFAMVEAGFVRVKNVSNILMKNMLDACFGAIAFWAVGWAFAYGVSDSSNDVIGLGNFFLNDFDGYASWFFQFAFAATAATIVSGAMAERTKFSAYLVYTVGISAFIYPVVVHWGWDVNTWMGAFTDDPDGPWLGNGYVDFAGSGVVHAVGGFSALMGCIILGPRIGKFANGTVRAIPGHNVTLASLGMFILWVGWYGFNPGSTLVLSGGGAELAARVAVTTTLAGAAGGCTMAVFTKMMTGHYDVGLTINGVLGGLVGITAGCATVDPWAAVVIGAVAALIVYYAVAALDKLGIDDVVGAFPVHGAGGMWGVLAVGLFSSEDGMASAGFVDPSSYGLLLGGGIDQLAMQVIGLAAIIAWVVVTSSLLFLAIKYTIGLRVTEEEEMRGLDLDEHGIDAYPDFGSSAPQVFDPAVGK